MVYNSVKNHEGVIGFASSITEDLNSIFKVKNKVKTLVVREI
jgi:hypothetical protein